MALSWMKNKMADYGWNVYKTLKRNIQNWNILRFGFNNMENDKCKFFANNFFFLFQIFFCEINVVALFIFYFLKTRCRKKKKLLIASKENIYTIVFLKKLSINSPRQLVNKSNRKSRKNMENKIKGNIFTSFG